MSGEKATFFYSLWYPSNCEEYYGIKSGTMFYCGIGTRITRPEDHIRDARNYREDNPHKNAIIRQIENNCHAVSIHYEYSFADRKDASMYEIACIFFMPHLTNITAGGELGNYGKQVKQSSKIKMSIAKIGNNYAVGNSYWKDKHHTIASKEKISRTTLGKTSNFKGKNHKQQTIDKIRATKLKNKQLRDQEHIQQYQKQLACRKAFIARITGNS